MGQYDESAVVRLSFLTSFFGIETQDGLKDETVLIHFINLGLKSELSYSHILIKMERLIRQYADMARSY